jgi:hypothetical protein
MKLGSLNHYDLRIGNVNNTANPVQTQLEKFIRYETKTV